MTSATLLCGATLAALLIAGCGDADVRVDGGGGTGAGTSSSGGAGGSGATAQGGGGSEVGGAGGVGGTGGQSAFVLSVATEVESGGGLVLITNQPRTVADCGLEPMAPCEDLDGDGLTDAWEDIVLERMRPIVRLDEDEKVIDDAGFVTANIGRVTPADPFVLVYVVLGYARDFGSCGGFTSHNGDTERVALELAIDGGDPQRIRVRQAYTAAHEGTANDHGQIFAGGDLSELLYEIDPTHGGSRWVVFASANKHATYATASICEGVSIIPCVDEDCSPDGVTDPALYDLSMPFANAGEPNMPLLTDLAALGFVGDDAWLDQDFCGGLGGNSCSSSVRSKLITSPFEP